MHMFAPRMRWCNVFFYILGDYIYLLFSCISLGMPVGPGVIGRHWSSLVVIGCHWQSLAVIGFQTHRIDPAPVSKPLVPPTKSPDCSIASFDIAKSELSNGHTTRLCSFLQNYQSAHHKTSRKYCARHKLRVPTMNFKKFEGYIFFCSVLLSCQVDVRRKVMRQPGRAGNKL